MVSLRFGGGYSPMHVTKAYTMHARVYLLRNLESNLAYML